MIVHIRLDMSDEMMRAFKDRFGILPRRKNVVAEVNKMLQNALFPDGPPKKKKFKLTRG